MKRKKQTFFLGLLTMLCVCTSVVMGGSATAQTALEGTNANVDSPADLWVANSAFVVEENVEVPDYMKYGKILQYPSTEIMHITPESEEDYLEDWETNGVKLTSSVANKSIEYANLIDISTLTKQDDLIVLSALTKARGMFEYTTLQVTLTDALDETNWVTISFEKSKFSKNLSFVKASTPDISPRGYRYGGSATGVVDTNGIADAFAICADGYTRENVTTADNKGVTLDRTECRHRAIKLHYDAKSTMFSVTGQAGRVFNILQLNDGHSVGYGNEWKGFKSNFVKLSISMSGFNASEASALILSVNGTPMNGTSIQDTKVPVLTVQGDSKNVPLGKIGRAYPLFPYQCEDLIDGTLSCAVTLTNPYGETSALTDDYFIPEKAGNYTIRYVATDRAGNASEYSYQVFAQNAIPTIQAELSYETLSAEIGASVALPQITVSGGAGALTKSVAVKRVGALDVIAIQADSFIPKIAGEYIIEYTITDYVGNQERVFAMVMVNDSKKAVLEGELQQIRRLFDGVQVVLPKLNAYDYVQETGVRLKAQYTLKAMNADGSYCETIENGLFTPDKQKFGDFVRFEYTYYCKNYQGDAQTYSYEVPLLEKAELLQDYFGFNENEIAVKFNQDGEGGYINFSTKEGVTGTKEIEFVNALPAKTFNVAFSVPGDSKNFQSITFILQDSENANKGFEITLLDMTAGADKDTMTYVVHNGVYYAMNGIFNDLVKDKDTNEYIDTAGATPMQLNFKDGTFYDYLNKKVFMPTTNFDGTPFTGFSSGKVYFTIRFNGVTEKSGISLTRLCGQTLYAEYAEGELLPFSDEIKPTISLATDTPDALTLGQVVRIPYAYAYDVITPYLTTTFTLTSPSGKTLYKNEKMKADLTFVVEEYGTYRLTYTAKDASENKQTVTFSMKLMDVTSPTITVGASSITVKSGKIVNIPKYVVLDDTDTQVRVFIYVVASDNTIYSLLNEEKTGFIEYTAGEIGNYKLVFYAIDKNYNASITEIPLTVV